MEAKRKNGDNAHAQWRDMEDMDKLSARAGQMLFTLISYSPNSFAVIRVK